MKQPPPSPRLRKPGAGLITLAALAVAILSGCGCGKSASTGRPLVATMPQPPSDNDKGVVVTPGTPATTVPPPPASSASTPQPAPGAETAPPRADTPEAKGLHEARDRFLKRYPPPGNAEILEARESGRTWHLRIRASHGPLLMSQTYQEAYGGRGYKVVAAKVSVVNSRTHAMLTMRKGTDTLDMRAEQDDADPNVTRVTLSGG